MKAIRCELCGNNQLIKKDGFFQCEYCGTKYTLEEAKKLIISGSVQVEGDVKTKDADFIIKAGTLERYNGESTVVTIPGNVKKIGKITSGEYKVKGAFEGLSIEKVIIPDNVTYIGHDAFRYCSSLTSITIPDSVTSIEHGAFADCTSLTSITIPDSVTSIGNSAFSGCTSLTSVTIPDSVTSIGAYTFSGCTSLTSITIPNSVTSIGSNAFNGCTSLTSITIPDSVTSIEDGAFAGCTALDPAKFQLPISVSISKDNIFDYSFAGKGYCYCCAGQIKHSFLFKERKFGKKCVRCGKIYP
ncbi:MAG: leucine-rich repeat protein [Oscillospiraceae bacterium]|nr:leucine-rich repeat protein [Oscillospiraceae bacterium]